NIIRNNANISKNWNGGICLGGGARSNSMIFNQIYQNDVSGFYLAGNQVRQNTIESNNVSANQSGFLFMGIHRNYVRNNRIRRSTQQGIDIDVSASPVSNVIELNQICSNSFCGISLSGSGVPVPTYHIIRSNVIFEQSRGIEVFNADRNMFRENRIFRNSQEGIYFGLSSQTNYVVNNRIYSNRSKGVAVTSEDADFNSVLSNTFSGPGQAVGLYCNADSISCLGNVFSSCVTNGLRLQGSTNSVISGNRFLASRCGLSSRNSYSSVFLNSMLSNIFGAELSGGSFQRFDRNNLQTNQRAGFTNSQSGSVKVTNNWWGTTLASRISQKIKNIPGYPDFTPYRLFNPFDITPGADTDPPVPVTGLSAGLTNFNQVILRWNARTGIDHYNIYWKTNGGTTNLQHLPGSSFDVIATTDLTNFIHAFPKTGRTNYYHVTASDDSTPFTNECWYSAEARLYLSSSNAGPFYVDDDSGNDLNNGTFGAPFRTVRRAAGIMMPGTAVPVCYIFPGTYRERVMIFSNKNPGYMVFTRLSNTRPVFNGSLLTNNAFLITNAGRVILADLAVCRNVVGIRITGSSESNIVTRNLIWSNTACGISVDSDDADRNYISSNQIWGLNQNNAVNLFDADHNTVVSNKLFDNEWAGVRVSMNAVSNRVEKNKIWDNRAYGIFIYITRDNQLRRNDCSGSNQPNGIRIDNSHRNTLASNILHHNSSGGLFLNLDALTNDILCNDIFSNGFSGIYSYTGGRDHNLVSGNRIQGNGPEGGIYVHDSSYTRIFRNLITKNGKHGIKVNGASSNVRIINNTVFGSTESNGVAWQDTSYGEMFNNIILSNQAFGISQVSSATIHAAFNDLYANISGPTSGNFFWGNGNIFQDPLLETVTSFTIASVFSPVLDRATNIPGVSDVFIGPGPDMGWKESMVILSTQSSPGTEPEVPETIYPDLGRVAIAPNPFVPGSGKGIDYIMFYHLTPEFEVHIYTIAGTEVTRFRSSSRSGRYQWDVKKKNGESLRSGVYICLVTNPKGEKKYIKFIVIR
ncbi:MAG: right-handed parallel beta-helix repeat-containing protein, partial [bacterium]|nr:right-handed parallel beta-helix repeat-containing protein [bacterium]